MRLRNGAVVESRATKDIYMWLREVAVNESDRARLRASEMRGVHIYFLPKKSTILPVVAQYTISVM